MISEQQHRKKMLDGILGTKQEKDLVNLCTIPVTLSVFWQSYMYLAWQFQTLLPRKPSLIYRHARHCSMPKWLTVSPLPSVHIDWMQVPRMKCLLIIWSCSIVSHWMQGVSIHELLCIKYERNIPVFLKSIKVHPLTTLFQTGVHNLY